MNKKLNSIFNDSLKIKIDDTTKLVIMSDCHRGIGDNRDSFLKNKNIFQAALFYYYNNGFTYVELGDGDDIWEVGNYKDIIDEYLDIFKIFKKFYDCSRLIMVCGNHDICKKEKEIVKNNLYKYYDNEQKKEEDLLNNIVVYEALVLDYKGYDIFMIHGHQVDLLSGTFHRLSSFLVKHVWRHLKYIGFSDPTGTAKNYRKPKKGEKKLKRWSIKSNKIIIAGHTHRPIYPKVGESLYFNDGSCIHPNGITCLEIENGCITLVKWFFDLDHNNLVSINRVVIEGKEKIMDFFL